LPISFNRCYYKRHYAAHQSHQISGNVAHKQNMRLHGSFSCRARFCVKLSPLHVYGSASKSLHVGGDMDGVTIAVPDPPQKKPSYTRTLCGNRNNQTNLQPFNRAHRSRNGHMWFSASCLTL
jgi:hypothetical protein